MFSKDPGNLGRSSIVFSTVSGPDSASSRSCRNGEAEVEEWNLSCVVWTVASWGPLETLGALVLGNSSWAGQGLSMVTT